MVNVLKGVLVEWRVVIPNNQNFREFRIVYSMLRPQSWNFACTNSWSERRYRSNGSLPHATAAKHRKKINYSVNYVHVSSSGKSKEKSPERNLPLCRSSISRPFPDPSLHSAWRNPINPFLSPWTIWFHSKAGHVLIYLNHFVFPAMLSWAMRARRKKWHRWKEGTMLRFIIYSIAYLFAFQCCLQRDQFMVERLSRRFQFLRLLLFNFARLVGKAPVEQHWSNLVGIDDTVVHQHLKDILNLILIQTFFLCHFLQLLILIKFLALVEHRQQSGALLFAT